MDRMTALMAPFALFLTLASPHAPGAQQTTVDAPAVSNPVSGEASCPLWQSGIGSVHSGSTWLSRLPDLNLTPEQRQAIQDVAERYRARSTDLAQRAAAIREQLVAVPPEDPGYGGATDRSAEAAAGLAADTVRLLSELRAEIHALLTEEQRQRLQEQTQLERKRWDDWRARHKAPQ